MKRLLATASAIASVVLALSLTAPASQADTGTTFAYVGYAGGTKITAVGLTVSSDRTAESSIGAVIPTSDSNQAANLEVSSVASIGAVNTDVAAVQAGEGFEVTGHARTAGVNLFNGLIRADAVDTTMVTTSTGASQPTTRATTSFVRLSIAGKSYPATPAKNTVVNVPGVATIILNYHISANLGDSIGSSGAGLVVKLLSERNGIAAGAKVVLNPTFAYIQPRPNSDDPPLGGIGYGARIEGNATTEVRAETGELGALRMPLAGTEGELRANRTGSVSVSGVMSLKAIESTVQGTSVSGLGDASVTSQVVGLRLFPTLLGPLISADAIGSNSHARVSSTESVTEGTFQFVNLRVGGKLIPADVAPNTQIHVANLGTVTLNKRSEVSVPGYARSYEVVGLHLLLDTARAGLPIGAEIEIGVSRAIVWR